MKTWISFLLPDDEYKEKRLLYFFSEGSILLFISIIIMLISSRYIEISLDTSLLVLMAIFLLYVSGRYILSGIEYTDITTEKAYRKEVKHILFKTVTFVVLFTGLYVLLVDLPNSMNALFEMLGLLVSVSAVMFLASYLSLKFSYKKNKELL